MTEKKLNELFDEAYKTGEIDLGDRVFCDSCGEEWTGRQESGGLLFGSKAFCPVCAPSMLEKIMHYHEERYIRGTCPPDQSYWQWCLKLRGGNNTIKVFSL